MDTQRSFKVLKKPYSFVQHHVLGGPECCWRGPNRVSSGYGTVGSLSTVSLKVMINLHSRSKASACAVTPDVYLSYAERAWNPSPAAAKESCLWRHLGSPNQPKIAVILTSISFLVLQCAGEVWIHSVCQAGRQSQQAASVAQLFWHRRGNKGCRGPEAARQRGITWGGGEGWMEVGQKEPSGVEIIQSTWGVRAGFLWPWQGLVYHFLSTSARCWAQAKPDVKLWLRCFLRPDPMQYAWHPSTGITDLPISPCPSQRLSPPTHKQMQ